MFLPCISLASSFPLSHIGEEQKYSLFFVCVWIITPVGKIISLKKKKKNIENIIDCQFPKVWWGGEQKFIRNK